MCDTAVAFEAVTAGIHLDPKFSMDIAHGGLMAAQAVIVDGLTASLRNLDVRRIVAEHFMIRIHHASPAFLDQVDCHIVMRQMAVRTFEFTM